ncbi:MAG: PAS domain S-box protein [Myxococcota bacterium]|nr:PAS domain S-box protein [Myxococcota bacterium]
MSSRPLQILLADPDPARRAAIDACARDLGLGVRTFDTLEQMRDAIGLPGVGVVVIGARDEVGAEAEGRVRAVRQTAAGSDVPILAVTADGVQADSLLEAGADDVIRWPMQQPECAWRIRAQLRIFETITALAHKERDAKAMLELTQTLSSSLDFSDILYTVVRRIADVVNVDRVSIVLSPESESGHVGYVVAASDDQGIQNLRIDLEKYPEILEVLRTRAPLTIRDASTHPVLEGVRGSVPEGALGALTLLPIVWQEEAMGVLFLRAAQQRGTLEQREVEFCQIVANATAVALRNARIMQTLRDQTQQVNFARFEAERRLRTLKRYANLFTSAADGLAAVDPDGQLLFANPRAYEIAGVTEDQVRGRPLLDLLEPADRRAIVSLWRGVRIGKYPQGVDLRMKHEDGRVSVLSCSFASLIEGEGAVLFSFRDVTKERATAAELAKTKDFLESLIDASVDAIIAADLSGNILLFNSGAERIYGWPTEDVIGKKRVSDLYPPGGAREVMRMIRSPQHGGPGRLETVRFDAIDQHGRRVPINLSAAMIYDERGKPFASVGIFTDLREKLRVEERLVQAQQKLAVSEKQALIAELAGTTAHELNQPLTSVINYAQLLVRKIDQNAPEHHYASVIVREGERMAEIVRKIGKITRYETKSYVGQTKILDLDAAAESGEDVKGTRG